MRWPEVVTHALSKSVYAATGIVWWWWMISQRVKRRGLFPRLNESEIRYRDRAASGNSQKNLLTKRGGASRALDVIVVGDELWMRTKFPFSLLFTAAEFDLQHRVALKDIIHVERIRTFLVGERLRITFRDWFGDTKVVDLQVHDPDTFLKAILRDHDGRPFPPDP